MKKLYGVWFKSNYEPLAMLDIKLTDKTLKPYEPVNTYLLYKALFIGAKPTDIRAAFVALKKGAFPNVIKKILSYIDNPQEILDEKSIEKACQSSAEVKADEKTETEIKTPAKVSPRTGTKGADAAKQAVPVAKVNVDKAKYVFGVRVGTYDKLLRALGFADEYINANLSKFEMDSHALEFVVVDELCHKTKVDKGTLVFQMKRLLKAYELKYKYSSLKDDEHRTDRVKFRVGLLNAAKRFELNGNHPLNKITVAKA
ncbi:MAG: hypothetical protein SPL31_00990 [Succinivibrio sp.]|nr:hypothetical protein [Succinivibrio sp.]